MLVEYQPRGSNHSEATTPDVEMEPERFFSDILFYVFECHSDVKVPNYQPTAHLAWMSGW